MNKIELAEASTVIDIVKYYEKKVITNFRNDKWKGKIKGNVSEAIRKFGGAIIAEITIKSEATAEEKAAKEYTRKLGAATSELNTEITKRLEKKYEHFIPIPTASFKTRWKFLWFGKLA